MALTIIERNVQLDLYDHDLTPSKIKAIALDSKTRYVGAEIHNGGQTYDVGQNTGVTLTIIRPDKTGVQITGETFQYTVGGESVYGAYAELTQTALAISGILQAQFMLTSGDQILRTEIFSIANGVALDAEVSEWAGEYQGYNLDELVQSVNESVAKVDAMEQDVSELKEGFSELYNSAYVTDSASGSIAHFMDGADNIPIKSLKVNIEPVQSGSGDPSPDNVRPISGWDSVKVTRTGKNLLPSYASASITRNGITLTNNNGVYTLSGTASNAANFDIPLSTPIAQGTEIYIALKNKATNSGVACYTQAVGPSNINGIACSAVDNNGVFMLSKEMIQFRIRINSEVSLDNFILSPMITIGTEAPIEFEPYSGETYEVSLASACTVYGGTLDVVSGELTVDREYVPMTAELWKVWNNYSKVALTDSVYNNREIVACDSLKVGELATNGIKVRGTDGRIGALPQWAESCTTIAEFKTALENNPAINIVITLATPLTYQLSATEIKSLLGINNVWSDAGDVDVEYRADTKLYIKRLTDSDTDMIADANITSGKYFMVGNDLYKATVNIASGAQIVVGTNATKVSLSEALNEINA